jgi:hypothetical protein
MHISKAPVSSQSDSAATSSIRPSKNIENDPRTVNRVGDPEPEDSTLSALSKQLSAAAQRALARDGELSRTQLAALATSIYEKLMGATYTLSKSVHDEFLPDTDNPELLDRAQRANDFAKGLGPNPFAGLSAEQLSLITYDESGDFTINERRAAALELGRQRSEWTVYITQKMEGERLKTGGNEQGIREIIEYYRALPPIEEAQIQGNWEVDFMMLLSRHEDELPEWNTTLIGRMANEWRKEDAASNVPTELSDNASRLKEGNP